MANSKNWTPERAREYYEENKEKLRIQKRRRYLKKKGKISRTRVTRNERVYN